MENSATCSTNLKKPLCKDCGKYFQQRKNLYEHIRSVHKKKPNLLVAKKLSKCPICGKLYNNRLEVFAHLAEVHNIKISREEKAFNKINEFKEWKENMENANGTQYILERGVTKLADQSKKLYYHCSRSGYSEKKKCSTKRSSTTKKLGKLCPATIEVVILPDETVNVAFWPIHIGHIPDILTNKCTVKKTISQS